MRAHEYDVITPYHLHALRSKREIVAFLLQVVLGYSDMLSDILCAVLLACSSTDSSEGGDGDVQAPILLGLTALFFVIQTSFIVLSIDSTQMEQISSYIGGGASVSYTYVVIASILQLRLALESIISISIGMRTVGFCIVDLIQCALQSFLSSLVQIFLLIAYQYLYKTSSSSSSRLFQSDTAIATFFCSITISILRSSWTYSNLLRINDGEQWWPGLFGAVLFFYFAAEKLFRLLYFSLILIYLLSMRREEDDVHSSSSPTVVSYLLVAVFILVSLCVRYLVVRYSHQRIDRTQRFSSSREYCYLVGKLLLSLTTSHNWIGEHVLTARLIGLELIETIVYFPLFIWVEQVTQYESHRFDWQGVLPSLFYLYSVKTCLLLGLLSLKAKVRHMLVNHLGWLLRELMVVLVGIAMVWCILILLTFVAIK